MNLEAYIKGLILEGKSSQEIATLVSDEYPKAGVDEILTAIKTAKQSEAKASQVGLAVLKDELKDELSEALKAELKASVDESLAKIQVNLNTYKSVPTQNVFDFKKGEYKEVKAEKKEAYQKMGELLTAYTRGDMPSMHSISKEIEQEDGIKAPAVSDVSGQGGYAIPTLVREDIFQLQYASTPIMSLMRVEEIAGNAESFPILGGITITAIADQSTDVPEKTPVFTSSTLNVYRFGGFTNVSNTFLLQKSNLVNSFVTAYASASARAMEKNVLCGIGASELVTGIVFDANTTRPTAYALSTLTITKLSDLLTKLNDEATSRLAFVSNKKVRQYVGLLEHGNNPAFPMFIGTGPLAPFGVPFIECPKIPSTLDVGAGTNTGGTDDVLILADFEKIVLGVGTSFRFDLSKDYKFNSDQTTMRAIHSYGVKVLAPGVCLAQELTN